MKRIAIVGASGGIGAAILAEVCARDDVACVYATYHQSMPEAAVAGDSAIRESGAGTVSDRGTGSGTSGDTGGDTGSGTASGTGSVTVEWAMVNAASEGDIRDWLDTVGELDWLINCCGFLHDEVHGPEKTIRDFHVEHFNKSMAVNCLPTLLLGKYAGPVLKRSESGVFATVSARVGSIEDNHLGGWYSYRASKAALNMALKCLAIEWQRVAKRIRVVALHPGTTDTALSVPFQANVPAGKLFPPAKTAGLLIKRIDELQSQPSGRFIAYDAEEIPW